ncbi:AEC family transporter [Ancylobacter defluvii]|uniref:Malonate transporter n=1 Tax=Ancylobacter defluvii TaxID=1282440 RepID=A0A9W6JXN2_9HYPH|nr:AEC family transporter [Ancylobacter defluvii]MBS7586028.1 AEC family transporter [Ancylobacter defluvii]GLK84408.1 malonate transporter [Ancylobacter defluvii]
MADVLALALPFFGVIFLGLGCGKIARIPESGLAWLSFFIIYVALPALFYSLVARTPFHELANGRFILVTTLSTATCFALSLAVGLWLRRNLPEATISAIVGSYSNVGYMGPGLTLGALGAAASVPTALIFVFDSLFFFTVVPLLMALGGRDKRSLGATLRYVVRRVVTHPFNVATFLGVLSAAIEFHPPAAIDRMLEFLKNAAAPCALFTLGVSVALRPMGKVSGEVPFLIAIKLLVHPLLVFTVLMLVGGFSPVWVATAVLMAGLPPALNAFIMAKQYETYVEGASGGVLIGTVVSVATVTALLYAVQHDMLPHGFN